MGSIKMHRVMEFSNILLHYGRSPCDKFWINLKFEVVFLKNWVTGKCSFSSENVWWHSFCNCFFTEDCSSLAFRPSVAAYPVAFAWLHVALLHCHGLFDAFQCIMKVFIVVMVTMAYIRRLSVDTASILADVIIEGEHEVDLETASLVVFSVVRATQIH